MVADFRALHDPAVWVLTSNSTHPPPGVPGTGRNGRGDDSGSAQTQIYWRASISLVTRSEAFMLRIASQIEGQCSGTSSF